MIVVDFPALDLSAARERVYMSPFHDTKAAYLDFVRTAQRSIRLMIFGFHLPEATDVLIEKHDAGVVVDLIVDHSQAEGGAELAELGKLKAAGVPFLIGVSPRHGQLLHLKATVVDDERVECGSWNYSASASDQLNDLHIIEDARAAHWYLLVHDIVRAFIVRHEKIFQPAGVSQPAAALTEDIGQDAVLDVAPDAGQLHRADVARPWLENARAEPVDREARVAEREAQNKRGDERSEGKTAERPRSVKRTVAVHVPNARGGGALR